MTLMTAEIQKNVWLEFSLHRVLGFFAVLFLVVWTHQAFGSGPESLSKTASHLFILLVLVWGTYRSAHCMSDETKARTWDWQRLSAISPWGLAFGKLIGTTLFNWFTGLFLLSLYAWAALQYLPMAQVVMNIALFVLGALLSQSAALLASLHVLCHRPYVSPRGNNIVYFILGLLVSIPFFNSIQMKMGFPPVIEWYGIFFDKSQFRLQFGFLYFIWMWLGLIWYMRSELKMHTGPWLWLGFSIFHLFYVAGFEGFGPSVPTVLFMSSLMLLVGSVLFGSWNGESYKRFLIQYNNKKYLTAADHFPAWVFSLILTGIAVIVNQVSEPANGLIYCTVLFYAIRDIAILHCFKLNRRFRRPIGTTLFYLFMLYVLIPVLLMSMKLSDYVAFICPFGGFTIDQQTLTMRPMACASGAIQALALSFYAYKVWKNNWSTHNQS